MKRFFRFLWLRAYDLLLSAGRPPYQFTDHQAYGHVGSSYSLRKAIRMCDVLPPTPSTAYQGPVKCIATPDCPGYFLKVDRLGRVHLPKALRERIL